MKFANDLYAIMARQKYMLCIRDEFHGLVMRSVFNLTENHIEEENVETFVRNRVFGTIVECVQNVCRHGIAETGNKNATLLLSRNNGIFTIQTITLITHDTQKRFLAILEKWSGTDQDELKEEILRIKLNTEKLEKEVLEEITIMDIMIKSNGAFAYSFEPTENNNYHFKMKICIKIS